MDLKDWKDRNFIAQLRKKLLQKNSKWMILVKKFTLFLRGQLASSSVTKKMFLMQWPQE